MDETVRHAVMVPLAPAGACRVFFEQLDQWWPREYTWGQDVLESIGIEPRVGGMCFERGPHGFRCDWGRVLTWEPPHRVAFTWQIGPRREPVPDPARASIVEIRFEAQGGEATRVTLEHRAFERHGDGAAGYRAALASPQGWPYILERFAVSVRDDDRDHGRG